jgi:hypothetical protein
MIICMEFGKLSDNELNWPKFILEKGLDEDNPMNWYFYNTWVHDFYNWILTYSEAKNFYDFINHPKYNLGQEEIFMPLSNSFINIIDKLPIHDRVKKEHKDLALWLKAWTILTMDKFGEDAGFCIY